MILPLAIAAAVLLVATHKPGISRLEGLRGSDVQYRYWRMQMSEHFKSHTLVGTGTEGLYNVQAIPNTTPALTHIVNGVNQGQTVFVRSDAAAVYFSSDGKPPLFGGWTLYAKPGGLIHG